MSPRPPVLTVGHSSRSWIEFLAVLRAHDVRAVVDVRSYPGSRRYPWFSERPLLTELEAAGIDYVGLGRALGGHRTVVRRESPHTGLPAGPLRAYADHMESAPFLLAVEEVLELGEGACLLCAERDPRDCHRSLLADHLIAVREVPVRHLLDRVSAVPHTLHPAARITDDGELVYDQGPLRGDQGSLF